jgi:adenylosuccinate lyase
MVRSAVIPALENIALWHERDISHSSVERNIGPDANITMDFALVRLTNLLDNMIVYPKKMLENLNITKGLIFSQELMLELTKSGLSREKSYKMVQSYAKKCFAENLDLFDVIQSDKFIMSKVSVKKLKTIFSYAKHFRNVNLIFRRVFR